MTQVHLRRGSSSLFLQIPFRKRNKPGVAGAAFTETHDARSLPCKHGSDSRLQGFEHPLERVESNEVRTRGTLPPSLNKKIFPKRKKITISSNRHNMTFKEYIFELQKKTRNFKHVCGQERKMSKDVQPVAGKNEIVVYQPEGGEFHIEVRVENETVWLTQAQMAELFNSTRNNITLHIKNIFQEHELDANSVCKESLLTANDGKKYKTKIYNLDVIISVGYRIKSIQGTRFRQWANQVLKEHLLRGCSINQRLISHENKLENHDSRIINLEKQVDFFVKTNFVTKDQVLAMVK